MKAFFTLTLITSALSFSCGAQVKGADGSSQSETPTFRKSFVLRLKVDDNYIYEENFIKVPYVADNRVYLFRGETFGIVVTVVDDAIARIKYEPDPAKADVVFDFAQDKSAPDSRMVLVIRNKLKHRLLYDALMTIPRKDEIYKTSVLPIDPGRSNTESWPHPIVQLMLKDFRFSQEDLPPIKK